MTERRTRTFGMWLRVATMLLPAGVVPAVAHAQVTAVAYVPDQSNNVLTVIDNATHGTSSIAVTGAPFGVAFTPDGRRAYVTKQFGTTVAVIDVATNAVVG